MEFVLDKATWRCGTHSDKKFCSLGLGRTKLLNNEGFMCCLGQFGKQLGHTEQELLDKSNFAHYRGAGPAYLDSDLIKPHLSFFDISLMAEINDNQDTTIEEKIEQLTKHLEYRGHTLKVIDSAE